MFNKIKPKIQTTFYQDWTGIEEQKLEQDRKRKIENLQNDIIKYLEDLKWKTKKI